MNTGFIKMHRKFMEWEWYGDNNTKVLFLHCLLSVNWADRKWRGKIVKRGTFLTSIERLAGETCISYQNVRTSLKRLKSTHEITYVTTRKGTCITVCKFDSYNCSIEDANAPANAPANGQPTDSQQTANRQLTSKGEVKEGKEGKELKKNVRNSADVEVLLNSIWNDSPATARNRSSREKVKAAFRNIKVQDRPEPVTVKAAILAWSNSSEWQKDNGQFVQGLHLWVKDKKWNDLPEETTQTNDNSSF